nr:electron transfer flavoprotein subunit alpha/FixB family protein [uncultured Cohaesibacter sp.]
MTTLLIAEHNNAALNDATAKALTAALELGGDVDILIAGKDCAAAAEEAAKLSGAAKILVAESDALGHHIAEALSAQVVAMADAYDAIVAPATSVGKNFMPRVAALLDVMQLSEITKIVSADTFERPTYAGNAIQTVKSADSKKVMTVRTANFAAAASEGSAPIENVAAADAPDTTTFVSEELSTSDRPELASARAIIAGGRGLASEEQFNGLLTPIADKLGAAIGASRAAVDAGYAPNDLQVGQTGKVVAPELYIAAGISGAIQHLAGMKDSKVIVAINKDEEAPIFQVADYGIVGDLFDILPELEKAL